MTSCCDMKKVLIMGLSKSGISAGKFLAKNNVEVFITESREKNAEDESKIKELEALGIHVEMGGHSEEFIKGAKLAITSPGIPPHAEIFKKVQKEGIRIISEVELAYLYTKKPFVAITGTNGKTTTTELTAHILNKKYKAQKCGNIGLPPCDYLEEKDLDYFVCEMSSFQIYSCKKFRAKIACWLTFTPDHVSWHGSLENYFETKASLFTGDNAPEFAVFNATDKKIYDFSKTCKDSKIFYFGKEEGENCCYKRDEAIYFKQNGKEEKIIDIKDCTLVGEHNYQNIMCSVIVAKLTGVENEKIKTAIMEFKAPEHRLEFVRKYKEIEIYNDSKATNPEASIVAINSFNDGNDVLIAGGRDKNTDLTEFCNSIKAHMKTVILIGEAGKRFEENLRKNGFNNIIFEETMQSAIDKGIELKPNVLLLSPACASFDMFKSYEDRGKVFKDYVLSKI